MRRGEKSKASRHGVALCLTVPSLVRIRPGRTRCSSSECNSMLVYLLHLPVKQPVHLHQHGHLRSNPEASRPTIIGWHAFTKTNGRRQSQSTSLLPPLCAMLVAQEFTSDKALAFMMLLPLVGRDCLCLRSRESRIPLSTWASNMLHMPPRFHLDIYLGSKPTVPAFPQHDHFSAIFSDKRQHVKDQNSC